jgi:hypothetical protein
LLLGDANGGVARILSTRPMRRLGDWSYSIYLWHWPVIVYARVLYPDLSLFDYVSCLVVTLLLAVVSYQCVEDPLRRNGWLCARSLRSVALGIGLSATAAMMAGCAWIAAKRFLAQPEQRAIVDGAHEAPITGRAGRKCMAKFTQADPVTCQFGAPASSGKTLVLFGDSHADQWSTPLASIASARGFGLVTYLKASCPVADVPIYNIRLRRELRECEEWRGRAIAEIIALRPAAIIISQASSGYIRGSIRTRLGERAIEYGAWKAGLERTLQKLATSGAPVVLFRDTPTPNKNVKLCLSRAAWRGEHGDTCSFPLSKAVDDTVTATDREAVLGVPNGRFVDLTNEFCNGATCPAERDGVPTYRDTNHITTSFSRSLASVLERQLMPMLSSR